MTLGKEAFQINILSFKRCKYLFSFLMAYFVLLMIFSGHLQKRVDSIAQ